VCACACVYMHVCEGACVRVRVLRLCGMYVCMYVCVCERESHHQQILVGTAEVYVCVCARVYFIESVCVRVYVIERERERYKCIHLMD